MPEDLSLAVLGDPPRGDANDADWMGFRITRRQMGAGALRMLMRALEEPEPHEPHERLLACAFHAGTTTAAPPTRKDLQ